MKALNTDVVAKPVWAQASRVAGHIVIAREQESVTIGWKPTIGQTFTGLVKRSQKCHLA